MPFRRSADTNPEAWYAAVRRIDQTWLANEAFQSTLWLTTVTPARSALAQPTPFLVLHSPPVALPSVPLRPLPPLSALSGGISMDVNAVRKTRSLPLRGYYQCEEANHLVKDCPHHLDVWRLTVEQRKELIEDLMALKDAVEEEEVCSAPEEGFV